MKLLVAAVAGGLIVFVWSAIAHMATPLGTAGLRVMPNEDAVIAAMKNGIPDSGLYFFPGAHMSPKMTPEEYQAWEAKIKAGPVGLVVYTATGTNPLSPRQLVNELLSSILAAGVAAFLVSLMPVPYGRRVVAVALLPVFASISLSVSYWNWYGFPAAFVGGELATELIGWLLAGLAIARIVPRPGGAATPGLAR